MINTIKVQSTAYIINMYDELNEVLSRELQWVLHRFAESVMCMFCQYRCSTGDLVISVDCLVICCELQSCEVHRRIY